MSFWNDKNISAAYRLAKTGTSDSGIAAQSQSKTTTMLRFPSAPRYPSRFPANLSEDDTTTFREVSPNSHRDHDDNQTNVDFRSLDECRTAAEDLPSPPASLAQDPVFNDGGVGDYPDVMSTLNPPESHPPPDDELRPTGASFAQAGHSWEPSNPLLSSPQRPQEDQRLGFDNPTSSNPFLTDLPAPCISSGSPSTPRRDRKFASSWTPRVTFSDTTPSPFQYRGLKRMASTPVHEDRRTSGPVHRTSKWEGYQAGPPVHLTGSLPNVMAPPAFDGSADVNTWINQFLAFARIRSWDNLEKTAALPCFFRGAAAAWFDVLEPHVVNSLTALCDAMRKRFGYHSSERWNMMAAWDKRVQGESESIDDYVMAVRKIGRNLQKSANDIRDKVARGLLSHLSEYVLEKEPTTLDEVVNLAKKANSFMRRRDPMDQKGVAALTAQIAALRDSLDTNLGAVKEQVMAVTVQTEDLKAQVTSGGAPQQPPPQPNVTPRPYQPQLPAPGQYQPQFPSPGPNPGNYRARPGPPGRMGPRHIRQGPPAPRGPRMGYGYRYSPCFRCGGTHVPSSCPFLQYQCNTCSSVGHLAKMCPQAAPKGQ